ncbi:hypothetical protein GCM10025777_58510 [Membranihabitans marinus]
MIVLDIIKKFQINPLSLKAIAKIILKIIFTNGKIYFFQLLYFCESTTILKTSKTSFKILQNISQISHTLLLFNYL